MKVRAMACARGRRAMAVKKHVAVHRTITARSRLRFTASRLGGTPRMTRKAMTAKKAPEA